MASTMLHHDHDFKACSHKKHQTRGTLYSFYSIVTRFVEHGSKTNRLNQIFSSAFNANNALQKYLRESRIPNVLFFCETWPSSSSWKPKEKQLNGKLKDFVNSLCDRMKKKRNLLLQLINGKLTRDLTLKKTSLKIGNEIEQFIHRWQMWWCWNFSMVVRFIWSWMFTCLKILLNPAKG